MQVLDSSRVSRPIHETVVTLGTQRGAPRVFARSRYLEKANFVVGTALTFERGDRTVVVRRSATPTSKHIFESKGRATLDLNERWLAEVFPAGVTRLHVRVETDAITFSEAPLDVAVRERSRGTTVGSLFSGAGLLDEAAVMAGLTPQWGVEIDPAIAEVFAANHPTATTYVMDVNDAAFLDLPRVSTILVGLPCLPFSQVRTTKADGTKRDYARPATDHDQGDLAFAAVLCIARLQPRTVLIECVPGLLSDSLGVALIGALQRLGYVVQSKVVNAADHGGLTARKRAVVVAQTPEADGAVRSPWPEPIAQTRTIADILDGDVPETEWISEETHPHIFARSQSNADKGRGFILRPTSASAPHTGTFTRESWEGVRVDSPLLAHPTRPNVFRRFTIAEAKRIMGLPEAYILPEAQTRAGAMLGQGVHAGLFAQILTRLQGVAPEVVAAARGTVAPSDAGAVATAAPLRSFGARLEQAELFG